MLRSNKMLNRICVSLIALVLFVMAGCQPGDNTVDNTGKIWDVVSTVPSHVFSATGTELIMAMTSAKAGESLLIKQSGLAGDFIIKLVFTDFTSVEQGSYFQMSVYPSSSTGNALSCGIGLLPGTTFPLQLSVSGGGSTNYSNASGTGGSFTITRTSTTIRLATSSGGSGPTDIVVTNYKYASLDVALQLGNNNLTYDHTSQVSVALDDFGVIGGGLVVLPDTFSTNLLKSSSLVPGILR
jgi:hypothetical protein